MLAKKNKTKKKKQKKNAFGFSLIHTNWKTGRTRYSKNILLLLPYNWNLLQSNKQLLTNRDLLKKYVINN